MIKQLALAGLVIIGTAHARLGETKEQAAERYGYGRPASHDEQVLHYQFKGFLITAQYRTGQIGILTYVKMAGDKPVKLSKAELTKLLSVNSGGSEWSQRPGGGVSGTLWETEDKKRKAYYHSQNCTLTVSLVDAKNEEKEDPLDGF